MLHDGCIAEIKKGEGKTLVLLIAAFFNALTRKGVMGMKGGKVVQFYDYDNHFPAWSFGGRNRDDVVSSLQQCLGFLPQVSFLLNP
ncbi:hypothetical protein AQUCO_01700574v1 [Aquilegia coerulea]|uniref:SecA family profile domain-containing protein n=1 Tax=Aquilegia coerulea TaxID=218851 RepID=A0A2G5DNM1_AQUCA|nr:hypothetical protein AQUCO_01700574v1 [Aquilegia coerulea]